MVFEDLKIAWLQGSFNVLPMYMGVIQSYSAGSGKLPCAPHVYGGDPYNLTAVEKRVECSPCIWG